MNNQPGVSNPQVQRAQQMFNSLSQGRKITLIAAVVGLIASFLPWYGASFSGAGVSVDASINGWHDWGLLAILFFIVAGALVLLPLFGISVRGMISALPPTMSDAKLIIGSGVIVVIAVLLFKLTEGGSVSGPGYSVGTRFGAWLALICGIAIAAGGYLMQNEPASL